ncbi:MAG: DUF1007 family protein [Planctomycetes bacterium]|nr:DUF1007 family protein [Planctomycetota bacterium]
MRRKGMLLAALLLSALTAGRAEARGGGAHPFPDVLATSQIRFDTTGAVVDYSLEFDDRVSEYLGQEADADQDGEISREESERFLASCETSVLKNLALEVDGAAARAEVVDRTIDFELDERSSRDWLLVRRVLVEFRLRFAAAVPLERERRYKVNYTDETLVERSAFKKNTDVALYEGRYATEDLEDHRFENGAIRLVTFTLITAANFPGPAYAGPEAWRLVTGIGITDPAEIARIKAADRRFEIEGSAAPSAGAGTGTGAGTMASAPPVAAPAAAPLGGTSARGNPVNAPAAEKQAAERAGGLGWLAVGGAFAAAVAGSLVLVVWFRNHRRVR